MKEISRISTIENDFVDSPGTSLNTTVGLLCARRCFVCVNFIYKQDFFSFIAGVFPRPAFRQKPEVTMTIPLTLLSGNKQSKITIPSARVEFKWALHFTVPKSFPLYSRTLFDSPLVCSN